MIARILIVLAAFAVFAPGVPTDAGGRSVLRLSDETKIPFDGLIAQLADSRAVFIGEIHSVPAHHRIQLETIRALADAGVPLMIGLEMFRSDSQKELDQWTAGALDEPSFRKIYERNWTISWTLYRDILLFARDRKIPLIGLNVDEQVTAKVARSGFSALSREERAKLPAGISCTVDETYEEFIRRAHGSSRDGRMFRHFCEAQMVWDSSMAHTLAAALARHPGRSAVVLAGSGHAWRRGIPTQLSLILPDLRSIVVLPAYEGRIVTGATTIEDADFVVY